MSRKRIKVVVPRSGAPARVHEWLTSRGLVGRGCKRVYKRVHICDEASNIRHPCIGRKASRTKSANRHCVRTPCKQDVVDTDGDYRGQVYSRNTSTGIRFQREADSAVVD